MHNVITAIDVIYVEKAWTGRTYLFKLRIEHIFYEINVNSTGDYG